MACGSIPLIGCGLTCREKNEHLALQLQQASIPAVELDDLFVLSTEATLRFDAVVVSQQMLESHRDVFSRLSEQPIQPLIIVVEFDGVISDGIYLEDVVWILGGLHCQSIIDALVDMYPNLIGLVQAKLAV